VVAGSYGNPVITWRNNSPSIFISLLIESTTSSGVGRPVPAATSLDGKNPKVRTLFT
jgi:hypothetical protein